MLQTDTLHRRIQDARRRFEQAGIESVEAAIDADVLARHALGGWERGQLVLHAHDACPAGFAGGFEALVRRRERREPTGYIIGHREFWNLDMEVGPGVLVPRPETEFLVEEALSRLSLADTGQEGVSAEAAPPAHARIADVGTGSGCVGVALARWLPGSVIVATDMSDEALAFARRNAERHDVAGRVRFVKADLLAGVEGPFDAIVSNPPYVPVADIAGLQPEVRDYEPPQALAGGADGLDLIRRLVGEAAAALGPGGWLLFEFGFGQAEGVRAIIAAEPQLELVEIKPDLAGIPRVAVAQRRSNGGLALSCLFCRIAAGELPAKLIHEDDALVAFHDVNPQAPVHVLIVPRRHIATLNDVSAEDDALVGAMLRRAAVIARDLGIEARGYRTVFNCNREAGQTVFHLHLHVLGGRPMRWPPG